VAFCCLDAHHVGVLESVFAFYRTHLFGTLCAPSSLLLLVALIVLSTLLRVIKPPQSLLHTTMGAFFFVAGLSGKQTIAPPFLSRSPARLSHPFRVFYGVTLLGFACLLRISV